VEKWEGLTKRGMVKGGKREEVIVGKRGRIRVGKKEGSMVGITGRVNGGKMEKGGKRVMVNSWKKGEDQG
jgi:hypothetical protein